MQVGSLIVAPYTASMSVIAEITSLTPKMVRYKDIMQVSGRARAGTLKYHTEVVCIDKLGPEIIMAKLQQNL